MCQFKQSTIAIDNAHTVPQKDLDYRQGLSGLNHVYGPNRPTNSVKSVCGTYVNIFTICTIRNQPDVLKKLLLMSAKSKQRRLSL